MGFQMKQANLRPRRPAAARRIAGHAQEDHILDPHQRQQKLDDDTAWPQCAAVYHKGRWHWGQNPRTAPRLCVRPAGASMTSFRPASSNCVVPSGVSIVRLVCHQEEAGKREHPLNRIITIEEDAEGIVINTTDIHLPRRIGEAVQRAFHGSLNEDFDQGGYFVRVNWTAGT
jgi:hypothetical protein